MFVEVGLYVVRYDNWDVGLLIYFDGVWVDFGDIFCVCKGEILMLVVFYMFGDFVVDGIGLFDVLGIDSVYVMGMLMGGMIV